MSPGGWCGARLPERSSGTLSIVGRALSSCCRHSLRFSFVDGIIRDIFKIPLSKRLSSQCKAATPFVLNHSRVRCGMKQVRDRILERKKARGEKKAVDNDMKRETDVQLIQFIMRMKRWI